MSEFIPVSAAAQMTADYRKSREQLLKPEFQGRNILCICETFEKAQVQTLLDKTDCAGIRVYYGMDESAKVHAILCAVDEDDADILPALSNAAGRGHHDSGAGGVDDFTLENGQRCPEECPPPSDLNGGV